MIQRLLGVITFKAPVYREIADDTTATKTAAAIVVVTSFITGFFSQLFPGLIGGVLAVVTNLIFWVIIAWILSTVAGLMGGKTNTGEMLRVTGFTSIFLILGIFNVFTSLGDAAMYAVIVLMWGANILSIIGNVIGVREAAEFSTGKAIATSIAGGVVNLILTLIASAIFTLFGLLIMGIGG